MKRILAVSTDQQLLEMLEQELCMLGFALDKLETENDLLTRIQNDHPDVLIIDFFLGNDNAAAVCHQIKSNPDMHDLPIIILSDFPGIDQLAGKLRCFAVIKKPMTTALLTENIIAALVAQNRV